MTTKQKLREAQQKVAEQRDRARAARLAGTATGSRAAPPATPRDARPQAQAAAPPLLLSRTDLREFYGISWSRETLRRRIAAGKFAAPVAFGPEPYARKAWRRDDIEAWVKQLNKFNYRTPNEAA